MLGWPQGLDLENASILGLERTVARNRGRLGGKGVQADFAVHAMGGADLSETDARARHVDPSPTLTHRRCVGCCRRSASASNRCAAGSRLRSLFLGFALLARDRLFRI